MKSDSSNRQVLIIDRQDYWRKLSVQALEQEGFSVCVLDNYDYPAAAPLLWQKPDLIILGCARIGFEELDLIKRVLEQKLHLLVLSTDLPGSIMRHLFLAGANDVTDKPYNPARLVSVVKEALAHTSRS